MFSLDYIIYSTNCNIKFTNYIVTNNTLMHRALDRRSKNIRFTILFISEHLKSIHIYR